MRVRVKCIAFFSICILAVTVLNLIKVFHVGSTETWILSAPNVQEKLKFSTPPETNVVVSRKMCKIGALRDCLRGLDDQKWVVIEVPLAGTNDPDKNGSVSKTNVSTNPNKTKVKGNEREKYYVQTEEEEEEYYFTTPAGFVEIQKEGSKKEKLKRHLLPLTYSQDDVHSPKKLRERMNQFSPDSQLSKFVKLQNERKEHEKKVCEEFKDQKEVASQSIILDREFFLTFCPIYKAASTTWSMNLLKLKGIGLRTLKHKPIQPIITETFKKVNSLVAPWVTRGTTRFMVVRHPFHRLISCYRDKFELAGKLYYYDLYGERMVRLYRPRPKGITGTEVSLMLDAVRKALEQPGPVSLPGNPFASPVGPTFREFIAFVAKTHHDDEHWRPYYSACLSCRMSYDFVLRFETLSADSHLFLQYLNLSNILKTGWENPTRTGATTDDVACQYFESIEASLMEKLIAKYQIDFKLFHYDQEEFLRCVKDYKG